MAYIPPRAEGLEASGTRLENMPPTPKVALNQTADTISVQLKHRMPLPILSADALALMLEHSGCEALLPEQVEG